MSVTLTTLAGGIARLSAIRRVPGSRDVLVGTREGRLLRIPAAGGPPIELVRLSSAIRDLAVLDDATGAVVCRGSHIYEIRFAVPTPTKLGKKLAGPTAVALNGSEVIAAEGKVPGRLVAISGVPPTIDTILGGLTAPNSLAVEAGGATVLVASGDGQIRRVDRAAVTSTMIAGGFAAPVDIVFADSARRLLLIADRAAGSILRIDLDDLAAAPVVLVDGIAKLRAIDVLDPTHLLIGTSTEVLVAEVEVVPVIVPIVQLGIPKDPLYLTSWVKVPVTIQPGGPAFDDLVFMIKPVETGCIVSYARDATFDPTSPDIILVAGGMVGPHTLIAFDKTTGTDVAAVDFEVTDEWTGPEGPPLCIIGEVGTEQPEGTWGGGNPDAPQNVEVWPQFGARQVGVAIIETNESVPLSAAAATALVTRVRGEVFDGVPQPGGGTESAREYFQEASHGAFDLADAGVVGPIRLPNSWPSYATMDGTVSTAAGNSFLGLEGFARATVAQIRMLNAQLALAGQPLLMDLRTVQSIVLVVRTIPFQPATATTAARPAQFAWPYASRPGAWEISFQVATDIVTVGWPGFSVDIAVPVVRTIQILTMPDDWTTWSNGRTFQDTVSHELGHNLGLPDEYSATSHSADAQARDVDNWSLMSAEGNLPHLSPGEKLILGWTRPEWVRPLSFALLGPVDETITLHAAELGAPPAGAHSAVEVRIGDGSNYYFEYRSQQAGGVGDQTIPTDRSVVGTDFRSGSVEASDRRFLLRIRNDADADAGEFQAGDDYEETDTSSPKYPNDFILDVLSVADDDAEVRIRYGDAKPDPQLTPWSAQTNWKSPDLEVRNARSQADPDFFDVPWEGHANTLHARVRNPGKVDAPGVRVDFGVKDYTFSGGAEASLGTDVRDVAAGATVEFTAPNPWVPGITSFPPFLSFPAHYCTVARIAEYADPGDPAIIEVTPDNNEAQSNHTRVISAFSSPASREGAALRLRNDRSHPIRMHTIVRQTAPLARTYLDRAWVDLAPGEEQAQLVMTEWVTGDETLQEVIRKHGERWAPNQLRLTGVATHGQDACSGVTLGGASLTVATARRTEFVKFDAGHGSLASGRIESSDTHDGVWGRVLVSIVPWEDPEREVVREGEVVDGDFRIELGVDGGRIDVQGHYLGQFPFAPCDSAVERIE